MNSHLKKTIFVYMQITTYINDLLYRYECVIIPGFGALLTQYHSAKIDSNHTFYPPGKTLSFNRQLQTNDGLLANYIASVENCSYELSLQKIRNFTGKLSLQLSENEVITLKNIGEFQLNNENSVVFTPYSKQNFSTASFGLASIVSPEIQRELQENTSNKIVKPLVTTPATSRPYLKYAAVALIAVSIAGFGGMKMYEGEVKKHNFAEKQKANTVLENQIQEATFVMENPLPALSLTFTKKIGKYHIIAGAFRVEENAHKKINQLQEKGYQARLIGVNKYGLHQVAYTSFESRKDALQSLRQIKTSESQDAWLLVQEIEQ